MLLVQQVLPKSTIASGTVTSPPPLSVRNQHTTDWLLISAQEWESFPSLLFFTPFSLPSFSSGPKLSTDFRTGAVRGDVRVGKCEAL